MRLHVFLLAATASALVNPQSAVQNDADITQLREVVQRIKDRAPQESGGGGGGITSAFGDVTTLLTGLSDSLSGLCNLRQDITSTLDQISSFGF
ncbi:hypothetical protein N0V93_002769 [Gnomoniopsis smithogilvyi]|uniref:Uncharacterized protein n=1 Tax=Gnomoniopsis smithogilvyi TaxID=1191159 RepID=A0A9W8YVW5_9PEZI|nr:hypothetical protein N0V93_002769 [Gnomoniopsis smithogilvyi]